jgi:hypothetical protein
MKTEPEALENAMGMLWSRLNCEGNIMPVLADAEGAASKIAECRQAAEARPLVW